MTRDSVLYALQSLEQKLRTKGVGALYLYGSLSRNQARADSDVDLFFDRAPGARIGLGVVGIQHAIEEALGAPVDFESREGLHPLMRADIEATSIQVF